MGRRTESWSEQRARLDREKKAKDKAARKRGKKKRWTIKGLLGR